MTLEPEWIEEYMPITAKTQVASSWAETTLNGNILTVPGNSMKSNAKMVAVRQDLMEKYGFDKLSNWEDYMSFCFAVAEKETPESGVYAFNTNWSNTEIWKTYYQQDNLYPLFNEMFFYECEAGDILPEFEEVKLFYETDLFRTFCHDMVELRKAGAWSQSAISNDTLPSDSFANLTSASVFHNSTVYTYSSRATKTDPSAVCEVYDLFPEAICIPECYSNNCLAIPYSSGDPQRAAMMIDLMKNDFFFNTTFQFGIEGTDWVDNGDNTFTLLESSSKGNLGSLAWALKYDWDYKEKPIDEYDRKKQEMTELQNLRLVPNPTVAFIFDDSNVKSYVATLNSLADEYRPSLYLGMIDDVDAYIDEFIQRLYDSGLQKIYDEMELQYNAWKETRKN
ncbi:MAG: ABC transporter substrate-binding protein [Clostridiales bacterium]|nr:ABC transporter substrate-binding protein [Clostridiales bacterium]